jgi:TPP-dependent pyruvate/acetoin dehydrogenase alpha subunit
MMLEAQVMPDLLRRMYRIRLFEERLSKFYDYRGYYQQNSPEAELERSAGLMTSTLYDFASSGMIGGAVHLCIGQEAVSVGVCSVLHDDDHVTSSHRGHGHFLAKTGDVRGALAELMGRATGVCGGCGGSMHLFDPGHGFLGGNGIIGAQIPIALGPAFAARYLGTQQVSVAFFGDGGANQGTLYESLNLAANWRLPVLFVCENNLYAATTPAEIASATADIAPRATGFGLPGVIVDGQDVLAVRAVAQEAVRRARAGEGPTFIEAKTYRFEGHCGAATGHANPEECALWQERDPIELFRERCLAEGWLGAAEQDDVMAAALAEVDEAERLALSSPLPETKCLDAFEVR